MAKRNCRFEVRLTKDEYYDLTKKARRAGLTTGAFVRMAVAGQEVHEAPSVDVPILIREVRRVGSNIDQILKIANGKGLLEVPDLRKALEENRTVEKMIANAYPADSAELAFFYAHNRVICHRHFSPYRFIFKEVIIQNVSLNYLPLYHFAENGRND